MMINAKSNPNSVTDHSFPQALATVMTALALARIIWCSQWLGIASLYIAPNGQILADMSSLFWSPISVVAVFQMPPSVGYHYFVWAVMVTSTLTLLLGLFTRASGVICLSSSVILMSMSMSWGKIHHDSQIMLLMLFVMLFSEWGRAFSFDSLIRKPAPKNPTEQEYLQGREWPLWMCTLVFALMYVSAGAHKLSKGYFADQGFTQFFKFQMVMWGHAKGGMPDYAKNYLIYTPDNFWLIKAMMLGALLFQLFFFLALLSRGFRIVFLLGMFVFHGSIGALTGVYFISPFAASLAVLVPSIFLELRGVDSDVKPRDFFQADRLTTASASPAQQHVPGQVAVGLLISIPLLLSLEMVVPNSLSLPLIDFVVRPFEVLTMPVVPSAYIAVVIGAAAVAVGFVTCLAISALRKWSDVQRLKDLSR